MRTFTQLALSGVAGALLAGAVAGPAAADAVLDFYKGNRLTVAIGFAPGGGFDRGGRVVAKHIIRYMPGKPTSVVQNMPGGGSLRVLNWLQTRAPRDGSAIAHFHPAAVREALLGGQGVRFKPRQFTWLGSYNRERAVTFVRADTGIKTIQDAMKKEVVIGATSPRSGGGSYPRVMNNMLGTRFKVIVGYGSTGESTLAMERGEVQGIGSWSWSQLKTRRSKWVKEGFVNVLIFVAIAKHPDLPNVPTPLELARNEQDRKVLEMIFGYQEMGRPFAAPPGLPADRARALRNAFDEMVTKADFKKDIEIAGLEVTPMDHKEVLGFLNKVYALPQTLIDRGRTVYAEMRSAKLSKAKLKKTKGLRIAKIKGKGRKMRLTFTDAKGETWKFKAREKRLSRKTMIDGKKAKASELKVGQVCTVSYYGRGGLVYAADCK